MSNPLMDRYNKQSSGGGGRRFDATAEILGYNVEKGTASVRLSESSAPVREGFPSEIDITISRYAAKSNRTDANFEGNKIDKRMAEELPVGEKVVLEGMTLQAKQNGPVPVSWINSTPGGNPEKSVDGRFTTSGYVQKDQNDNVSHLVTHVQQWPMRALSAEEFFTENMEKAFSDVADRHQQSRDCMEKKDFSNAPPVKPNIGVALRIVDGGEVVDFTPPVSYNSEEKRPLTMDEAKAGFEAFQEKAAEEYGESAKVEIIPVREHRVAPNSQVGMAVSQRGNMTPAGTMMRTATPTNDANAAPGVGNQSLSVGGVISLSPGELTRSGQRKNAENDWVTKAHFSARKEPIHDVLPDSDGNAVKMTETMRNGIKYPARQGEAEAGMAQGQESAPSAPAPAPEDAPPMPDDAADQASQDAMLDEAFNSRDNSMSPSN